MNAQPIYLQTELQEALHHARHLAECGVPLFVAERVLDGAGNWVPDGGKSKTGYRFPDSWQLSVADPKVVDRWRVGMALCAVMGHVVDGVDVDPRNGGDRSLAHMERVGLLPRSYGRQKTPSGGTHELVASLGLRSRDGFLPGVDFKAGVVGEGGHGFLFLAPTVKLSKETGELGVYTWENEPDLESLVLIGGDDSGAGLTELLQARVRPVYEGPAYAGRGYEELTDAEKRWADADTSGVVEFWRTLLLEAAGWGEGVRDAGGRGWEMLARDCSWALGRMVATPWNGLDAAEAEKLYGEVLPAEIAESCAGKWDDALLVRAAALPVEPPPWDGLGVVRDLEGVNATNDAVAAEWLRNELGMVGTPLAGLFRRGEEVVHTPRIDEDGYVALTSGDRDQDGPAQVRVAGVARVQSRVQFSYQVTKHVVSRGVNIPCLFPPASVGVVLGDVHLVPNLRTLRGVTHTPMLRADGTVLDVVGYDEASRRLYLPEAGLAVGKVPGTPSKVEVEAARELVLGMVADFPWNTVHDRANYLALLLTPLLRELVPPPYKLGAINAHQPGSGKSLLAWVLRTLHGGVLRGDVPKDGEEFRKQITSVLARTTAPVVQFDNARHLEATQLDALLTTDVWSDRVLGATEEVSSRNDRLWLATGNNITLGGDLVRRVLWVSIDPRTPHPEARVDFVIPDLKAWVRGRRGELLCALLTLVRAWVVAGKPVAERVGSDDYARWIEACRGVLAVSGIDGVMGHESTVKQTATEDGDDQAAFLQALWDQFGDATWDAAQAAALVNLDDTPDGMKAGNPKSIGKWLANHEGQWVGGLCARQAGTDPGRKVKLWQVQKS